MERHGEMYLSAPTSASRLIKSPTLCREECKTPWWSELFSRVIRFTAAPSAEEEQPCQASEETAPGARLALWRRRGAEDRAAMVCHPALAHLRSPPGSGGGPPGSTARTSTRGGPGRDAHSIPGVLGHRASLLPPSPEHCSPEGENPPFQLVPTQPERPEPSLNRIHTALGCRLHSELLFPVKALTWCSAAALGIRRQYACTPPPVCPLKSSRYNLPQFLPLGISANPQEPWTRPTELSPKSLTA